jgi:undecaprenyl-diphosphatase
VNAYIQSIILGIVEGLTEFLPVSSTAHLRITEALMKIPLDDAYWKMYTIVIQLGAILALAMLFAGRIAGFIHTFPKGEKGNRNWLTHPISFTLIAFACTSVPALLLHKWSEKNLGSLNVIAWALLIGGVVMWIVDAWAARRVAITTHVEEMSLLAGHLDRPLPDALGHLPRNLALHVHHRRRTDRRTRPPHSLEFSFLLSIPTMIAATVWDLKKGGLPQPWRCRARSDDHRQLDRAPHRLRRLLHRCMVRRRVVPPLGAQARLHHVRDLPHPSRHGAVALGNKIHRRVSQLGSGPSKSRFRQKGLIGLRTRRASG